MKNNFKFSDIDSGFHRDILIYAFRYALGRMSYSPSIMQDAIRSAWPTLHEADRRLIKREIREHKESCGSIGMKNVDEPGWMSLLELDD